MATWRLLRSELRDCGKWVSTSQIGTEPCQVSHGPRQCGVAPIVSQRAGFGTLHRHCRCVQVPVEDPEPGACHATGVSIWIRYLVLAKFLHIQKLYTDGKQRFSDLNKNSSECRDLHRIDGEPMVFKCNIFPGHTTLKLFDEIPHMMEEMMYSKNNSSDQALKKNGSRHEHTIQMEIGNRVAQIMMFYFGGSERPVFLASSAST